MMDVREQFGLKASSNNSLKNNSDNSLLKQKSVDFRTQSMKDVGVGLSKNSWIFHRIILFFADRKFITIAFIHLAVTLVIFTHFAMEKYNSQTSKVPLAAPRYTWKIGVPTFEFGTMHAILFQLGALPLTMCRLIISKASSTFLNTVIPFNEMQRCHIVIGYTLVVMLFFTIIVFLMFFGVNCADGNQAFCAKFTSEIMITGYVIFVFFLSVAVTSYLRTVIPYRVFYIYHHLVFITYAVTIAHTIDHVQRSKGGRSQTFKWFTASILLYITDRASMYLNQRYKSKILLDESELITSADGKKMIILDVQNPDLFYFHPGQYVYLKIPSVDHVWHPFSVASSPNSKRIVFYIEVFGEGSWTFRLFDKLQGYLAGIDKKPMMDPFDLNVDPDIYNNEIEIMGPYGTSLGNVKDYSHALIIGAGTGVVPILSMFQTHVGRLLSLDASRFKKQKEEFHTLVTGVFEEKKDKKGSLFSRLFGNDSQNDVSGYSNMKLRLAAYFHIYKYFLMFFGTILGVLVLGTAISWNLLTFEVYQPMKIILPVAALVFQVNFIILAMTVQEMSSIWFYLDVIFFVMSCLADWNFFASNLWGNFGSVDLFIFVIMKGYMTLRFWTSLLKLKRNPIQSARKRSSNADVLDEVHLVWTSRSPTLISQMFPDLEAIWNTLVDKFGETFASEVCDISIFCTSKDEKACEQLKAELKDYKLFQKGALYFDRPNFREIFEDHTEECMSDTSLPTSRTLVAFCGSPQLANHVKETKIINDLAMFTAGVDEHQMDLVIESYGGVKKKAKAEVTKNEGAEKVLETQSKKPFSSRVSMKSFKISKSFTPSDSDEEVAVKKFTPADSDEEFAHKSFTPADSDEEVAPKSFTPADSDEEVALKKVRLDG